MDKLYKARREKVKNLEEEGVSPYPYEFKYEHSLEEVINGNIGENYSSAGRLGPIRNLGGISFVHAYNSKNKLQLAFQRNNLGKDKYSFFEDYVDLGDYLAFEGETFRTNKGLLTVNVDEYKIIAKALRAALMSKDGFLKDKDKRYRKRYVDMISTPGVSELLENRSKITQSIRTLLYSKGFSEVETPILQPIYGGANARPFTTHHNALDRKLHLRISPELYLKRLTVGGMEKVFEFAKNFRNESIDRTHSPEFTMMELYQAYADYEDMMNITEEIFETVNLEVNDGLEVEYGQERIDFSPPFKKVTMIDAVKRASGINVDNKSASDLEGILEEEGVELKPGFSWGDGVQGLFELYAEPGLIQPTFVIDHPKETTPLCKPHREDDRLIERFELFIAGMELVNAYTELNDPRVQREFFEEQVKRKELGDEEAHEFDEDFLEALEYGLPPTGGLGIGIDRLVMVTLGEDNIKEIIPFPQMKYRR